MQNPSRIAKHYSQRSLFVRISCQRVGCVARVLPGVPSHKLLESYLLWIVAEKGTVIRPPGLDLEGGPTYSRSPTLTVLLILPEQSKDSTLPSPPTTDDFPSDSGQGGLEAFFKALIVFKRSGRGDIIFPGEVYRSEII